MNVAEKTRSFLLLSTFSTTLFISAACMFAIQPMVGKMLLPLVGGTPAGWLVAMAFFQVTLLGGYFLAYLFSFLPPLVHGVCHLAILASGLVFLPLNLDQKANIIQHAPTPANVFLVLIQTLGIPFLALACTSSTLQRLFGISNHPQAKDPYFLYAASNLGSFFGLLSYPFLIEPIFALSTQSIGWKSFYIALLVMVLLCIACMVRERPKDNATPSFLPSNKAAPSGKQILYWLILAFFPSTLLMGVTTFITTDIISAPLVWIIPLSVYLLSFVMASSRKIWISPRLIQFLFPFAIGGAILAFFYQQLTLTNHVALVFIHLLCFGIIALYCNSTLMQLRPARKWLTHFYLIIALGGALGGLFNIFIAPQIFHRIFEYPLGLLALPFLMKNNDIRTRNGKIFGLLLVVAIAVSNILPFSVSTETMHLLICLYASLLGIMIFLCISHGSTYPLAILGSLLISTMLIVPNRETVLMQRNFFGALRVYDMTSPENAIGKARYLVHGTTLHGLQVQSGSHRLEPTTYFSRKGPLGDIFSFYNPKDIAVIGLGAGTINCFNKPQRRFTFIDIDPSVVKVAQNAFTYISDCVSAAAPQLIIGDGRKVITDLPKGKRFDLIVIDAFSSDSIPVHLLTAEALRIYFDHLTPNGTLALHLSNRYFRLSTPVATTTDSLGYAVKYRIAADLEKLEPYAAKSIWMIVSQSPSGLNTFAAHYPWRDVPRDSSLKPWTDDYSNLLSALHL